jgi:hypothetical protein
MKDDLQSFVDLDYRHDVLLHIFFHFYQLMYELICCLQS